MTTTTAKRPTEAQRRYLERGLAQAGGKDPSKLDAAVAAAFELVGAGS